MALQEKMGRNRQRHYLYCKVVRGEDLSFLSLFNKIVMNKGAKVISQSIIGNDFRTIIVNKKGYTIYPPTIHSLSNAISYLCDVREGETLREILISLADLKYYAHALSWFINGDDSLFEELSKGTYEECVNGVEEAISMIDVSVFQKAVGLAKNVSLLAATPK